MKYLISLNKFVNSVKDIESNKFKQLVINYTNFLNKKPLLEYFIPCDEEGNVLEEPKDNNSNYYQLLYEEYKQAQSKVLFKNCIAYKPMENSEYYVIEHNNAKIWLSHTERTIEWFINEQLELTDTALKQIGL